MLTNYRTHHMLTVARKCYKIAKNLGKDETFCQKMWLVGYLHNIGYEFNEEQHEIASGNLLRLLGITDYHIIEAVRNHSSYGDINNATWRILVQADLQVNYLGNEVTVEQRLKDIETRYGEQSPQYINSVNNAKLLELI